MLFRHDRRRHLLAWAAGAGLAATGQLVRAQDNPIVLGQSAQLTGPLASSFPIVVQGQNLALNEFNGAGGVDGRPVKLITYDDGYDTARCVANVKRLIDEDRVTSLFGLASTAGVGSVMPLLLEKKMPLVGVYTGSPALRARHHPYFFTTLASYRDEIVKMLRNQKTLLRNRVGVVYIDNPFGQLMQPVVDQIAKEEGIEIVASGKLAVDGANAAALSADMARRRPQAIVLVAFGKAIVPYIRVTQPTGVPIYAISIANAAPLIAALGDAARGVAFTLLIPSPWRTGTGIANAYAKQAQKAGMPLSLDSFFGYLNMRVMLEALRRAGRGVTSASLVAAMEQQMGRVDFGGYTISFSRENHHGSRYVDIGILGRDGKFIL